MTIDFQEKMNQKLEEGFNKALEEMCVECHSMEEFESEMDKAFAKKAAEDKKEIHTEVWQLPDREAVIKEELQDPAKLSASKAQAYANHIASEEMGSMEDYLQILELQARRSFLFCEIDMDMVKKAIYNPVKAAYFDKHGDVQPEYVDLIINDYAERYDMEELKDSIDDINPDDWDNC